MMLGSDASVDVWRFDLLDAKLRAVEGVLDGVERRRAGRLVFDDHRRRFMAAHVGMRLALSEYLGLAPSALVLAVGAHGKPHLVGGGPEFNLSHSGDVAYLAVSADTPLGIDVELETPERDVPSLAEAVFSPQEREELSLGGADRAQEMFFRGWTRKEAYLKALGLGVGVDLSAVSVGLAGHDRVVEPVPGISGERVWVSSLAARTGEHLALATLTPFPRVRYRDWQCAFPHRN